VCCFCYLSHCVSSLFFLRQKRFVRPCKCSDRPRRCWSALASALFTSPSLTTWITPQPLS
jgi:hypothetical protein